MKNDNMSPMTCDLQALVFERKLTDWQNVFGTIKEPDVYKVVWLFPKRKYAQNVSFYSDVLYQQFVKPDVSHDESTCMLFAV